MFFFLTFTLSEIWLANINVFLLSDRRIHSFLVDAWKYVVDCWCVKDMSCPSSLGGTPAYPDFHGRWRTLWCTISEENLSGDAVYGCREIGVHNINLLRLLKVKHFPNMINIFLPTGLWGKRHGSLVKYWHNFITAIMRSRECQSMWLKWRNPHRWQRIANASPKWHKILNNTFLKNDLRPENHGKHYFCIIVSGDKWLFECLYSVFRRIIEWSWNALFSLHMNLIYFSYLNIMVFNVFAWMCNEWSVIPPPMLTYLILFKVVGNWWYLSRICDGVE